MCSDIPQIRPPLPTGSRNRSTLELPTLLKTQRSTMQGTGACSRSTRTRTEAQEDYRRASLQVLLLTCEGATGLVPVGSVDSAVVDHGAAQASLARQTSRLPSLGLVLADRFTRVPLKEEAGKTRTRAQTRASSMGYGRDQGSNKGERLLDDSLVGLNHLVGLLGLESVIQVQGR